MTAGSLPPSATDRLIAGHLAGELADLERFCELLHAEQEVLTRAEADKLPPLVEEKSALAGRLGQQLAEREQALLALGLPQGRDGMAAWLASRRDSALDTLWGQLLERTGHARRQQELNGRLLALQLQNTQQALAALMSASGRPLTYGPDGHQRMGGGGRPLGSA